MAFTPPAFALFRVNTLNLDSVYSTLLGRYKVAQVPNGEPLAVQQTSLEVLIARTNEVIKSKTDRKSQLEVFNLLVNELRQIPKDDIEKIKQGTLFLLGALIHRYFRLIKEYAPYDDYLSWTFFKADVTNCKLFLAIRRALQFKELGVDTTKSTFKSDDLKILDVVTIVRALEAFRDNMFLEDGSKVPRFMNYPHFAHDPNFRHYLQDIIDEQTQRGAALLHRYKAIAFIQSLVKQIDVERQQLDKDIEKWCKAVAKEYKNFSDFRALGEEAINVSLNKTVESELSKNIIFSLFYTPLIQDSLKSLQHGTFLTKMKECYDHTCRYKLFGGYVLLIQQKKLLDDNLSFTLQKALHLERSLDDLTNDDKRNGLLFFKEFLENEPDALLDCEFFGGRDKMNTEIARAEKELTQAIATQVSSEGMMASTC